MAYDTTTTVVDDVTDNLASYHNELKTAIDKVMSSVAYANYGTATTSSGTVTLTDSSFPVQAITCGTANVVLRLPAVGTANHPFFIINAGTAYTVQVQNEGSVNVGPVIPIATYRPYASSGTAWFANDGISVAPGTDGNVMTAASGVWTSAAAAAGGDGWTADANTWSYSSADGPTGVISVNADMTALIGVGDRIKLTQATVKYFIVTAVGAFGGGATLITVYGGTDYTLANAAITVPYYSHAKAPFGFPLSPAKWSVILTDTTQRSQTSPTQNTWYNLGSLSISIPIGAWEVSYKVCLRGQITSATVNCFATLSTANNSESDADFTSNVQITVTSSLIVVENIVFVSKILTLAAKTSYYLNSKTSIASQDHIMNRNDVVGLLIVAKCAYL